MSTGRFLAADRSEKGKEIKTRSPRSNAIPRLILGVIPNRLQGGFLSADQIAVALAFLPFPQIADDPRVTTRAERLPGEVFGELLGLFINQVGDGHLVTFTFSISVYHGALH